MTFKPSAGPTTSAPTVHSPSYSKWFAPNANQKTSSQTPELAFDPT
jgi:hypothetical protein